MTTIARRGAEEATKIPDTDPSKSQIMKELKIEPVASVRIGDWIMYKLPAIFAVPPTILAYPPAILAISPAHFRRPSGLRRLRQRMRS